MSTTLHNPRFRSNRGYRPQHIPGRGGYSSTVNYRRETPEPEQPSNSWPVRGIYSDPHSVMMLCSFMGTRTMVKTRNGSKYTGHTIGFSDKGDIAMSDVRLETEDSVQNPVLPGIIIPKEKFVVCKTNGVDLKGLYSSSFTDSGIANRINGSSEAPMKQLQPWQCDDDGDDAPDTNAGLLLDEQNDGWDSNSMFQANKDKFNVRSTYNEDLHEYTTRLPDPRSEGYEEKEKFAQKHAEEIEKSDVYQSRIAKELADGDEESLYSAVHRGTDFSAQPPRHQEPNTSGGKNNYSPPAYREDSEQLSRNDAFKSQGRGPHQSTGHPQHLHQQNMQQSTRQINNQFQGGPPSGGPMSRNQGPSSLHPRQQGQQSHTTHPQHHHHPPQQYQQQPPPHPGMQHHIPPIPQHPQQQRPPPHQQLASPNQQANKSQQPNLHHQQNLPSSSLPQQAQQPLQQKLSPQHKQPSIQESPSTKGSNINGPLGPPAAMVDHRLPVPTSKVAEANNGEVISQKAPQIEGQQLYQQKPPVMGPSLTPVTTTSVQKVPEAQLSASSSTSSLVDAQQLGQPGSGPATSPPSTLALERRVSRGVETSLEERNKIGQSLHDFKNKFVLDTNGADSQEAVRQSNTPESTTAPSTATSSVSATPVSSAPETPSLLTDQATEAPVKAETPPPAKYKLNPNAKEFKPKSQPVQMETHSPSPQPGSSPHLAAQQMVLFPAYNYIVTNPHASSQRKRATVSLGDLAAHQVTGQPLLATQPPGMLYLQTAGQPLPASYQMINTRMVAPGSLALAQPGQVMGMDQAAAQSQPQPVYIATQQQQLHTPIPAHLHPQPAHAQAVPLPASNQQAQPAHVPNPVPSPVHHQSSQPMPQPLPLHMSQGPPQSASTPQPAHYPVNYAHAMPTVPRTSGQQNLAAGHPSVNFISAPQFVYNGGAAQYTFAAASQASQNASHGPQPQYVIMPQPNTQGPHPPLQQHMGQPYTAANIPYQPQQHLMQGPPHMPPNHSPNASQSGHLIHPGMSASIHQQVSNSQPNVYMQAPVGTSVPSHVYLPKDRNRSASNSTTVSAPTIMFSWP